MAELWLGLKWRSGQEVHHGDQELEWVSQAYGKHCLFLTAAPAGVTTKELSATASVWLLPVNTADRMLTYLLEGDGVFLSWICDERDRGMFSN